MKSNTDYSYFKSIAMIYSGSTCFWMLHVIWFLFSSLSEYNGCAINMAPGRWSFFSFTDLNGKVFADQRRG